MIEFVTASHDDEILNANLLRSHVFMYVKPFIQRGYTNVSKAYNDVRLNGLTCFVHHDVYLPTGFIVDLQLALQRMERIDPEWGVLGVAGVKLVHGKKEIFGHICDRGKNWGAALEQPAAVDTLDEMLLITKGDLQFDEELSQDFYGADICMQAKLQGRKNYVINAYCEHNSGRTLGGRTESFYRSQDHFKNKWKEHLPIATTCALLS